MDTKHIHCMLEDVAKYGKEMVSCMVGDGNVNLQDLGEIIDIVKDLACAEKDALIAKEMRKANEEDEAEEKHFLKMLKDEYKDEFKKMKEEYGEDEGERRFYDNYRYKSSGRFAPKGKGSYMPRGGRRGYEEPMYHMPLEIYHDYSPEELRDIDREKYGRLYYTPSNTGNGGGQSGSSMGGGNMGGNSSGSTRGYSDGFDEGQRRGYSEGYEQGNRDGRSQGGNSRYERAKRGYEEAKEKHKGNTPEDKQLTMREAEKMLNVVFDEIDEMLSDAPPEMKNMVKTKGMTRFQKIQ